MMILIYRKSMKIHHSWIMWIMSQGKNPWLFRVSKSDFLVEAKHQKPAD
jgi:hypothetical protein